ncbi:MAG: hypothetical protein WBB45_17685 [Cyclobacteriaceae bacterium]
MKKLFAILLVCGFAVTFYSCEAENNESEVEESMEEVGDDMEDAAEDVEDEVDGE